MMRLIEWILGRGRAQEVSGLGEKTAEDTVIGEARSLADAGRYNEAIGLLTTENRRLRRRELDRTLLALRSEGFLAGTWKTEPPEWPSHVADKFGGEGVPEIRVDELSASSIRSGLEHHGSLIVREMISSSQVDMLRNNIERVIEAYDAAKTSGFSKVAFAVNPQGL